MRINLMACAGTAIKDELTKTTTLVSVLNIVVWPRIPVWIPAFVCYAQLRREPSESARVSGSVSVHSGPLVVATLTFDADFGATLQHDVFLRFSGIVIPRAGDVIVRLAVPGAAPTEFTFAVAKGEPGPSGSLLVGPQVPPPVEQPPAPIAISAAISKAAASARPRINM